MRTSSTAAAPHTAGLAVRAGAVGALVVIAGLNAAMAVSAGLTVTVGLWTLVGGLQPR